MLCCINELAILPYLIFLVHVYIESHCGEFTVQKLIYDKLPAAHLFLTLGHTPLRSKHFFGLSLQQITQAVRKKASAAAPCRI